MFAAVLGHTECMQVLLETKADVNKKNKDGNTALFVAAHRGESTGVQFLVDAKAKIDVKSKCGNTALMVAVAKGYRNIVQILLEAKAHKAPTPDARQVPPSLPISSAFKMQAQTIRDLVNSKVSLECLDQDGNTPLLFAVKHSNLADMSLLISNKANI